MCAWHKTFFHMNKHRVCPYVNIDARLCKYQCDMFIIVFVCVFVYAARALAHWLQGQPHERIIDFNGRYAAIRKMSYHAQLTNLSMRHDTTSATHPQNKPQINIKSTPTDSTHTGQTQLHHTHTRLLQHISAQTSPHTVRVAMAPGPYVWCGLLLVLK